MRIGRGNTDYYGTRLQQISRMEEPVRSVKQLLSRWYAVKEALETQSRYYLSEIKKGLIHFIGTE
jgi:hypothetical protein